MTNQRRQDITSSEYLVLHTLVSGPQYGYAIKKAIEAATGGEVRMSLATLYDSLHRLLDDGLIEKAQDQVIQGRVRRTYRITGLGQQVLAEKERLMRRMLEAGVRLGAGTPGLMEA